MTFDRLLAKKPHIPDDPRPEEYLIGHTAQVVSSGRELLALRGAASLRAAGLPAALLTRLERIVLLATFMHDLGKASDHFQEMIRGLRTTKQLVRHEALSLWLCWQAPLREWLLPAVAGDERDYLFALVAAAGHHRKFPSGALAPSGTGPGKSLTLLTGHPDFSAVLAAGQKLLSLGPPPALESRIVRRAIEEELTEWNMWADDQIQMGSEDARLLAIAKALVLNADVAGSALPRTGERRAWITRQLRQRASRETAEALVQKKLEGKPMREFQKGIAGSSAPVTLVRAGCGTGKTVAAYQWFANQHAGKQLWFAYPTTGTSTEGFRDYVSDSGVVGLLDHSRAEIDLEIFGLTEGRDRARDFDRVAALRAWGAEAVVCTVDTVLGLTQNQRKGLYAWAGLSEAAIVFDEIHAYDDHLFGSLLRFLEALPGIPALLMTASLPASKLRALRECVVGAHSQPLAELDGPAEIEALPRYRAETAEDPWPLVRETLAAGEKVLWVSNTVRRCLDLADQAPAGVTPLVYHSRFRYEDRVQRHRAIIKAFKEQGPVLALTTQVVEMSLDLSADLLITDLAPIAALIQRLGRLNRRSTPDNPLPPKPFVVLDFQGLPYERAELEESRAWLGRLPREPLSQAHLIQHWHPDTTDQDASTASAWLDGRFRTEAASVREAGVGVSVVLAADVARIRQKQVSLAEVLLPMDVPPARWAEAVWNWRREGGFAPVAPDEAIAYDEMRGARWQ